MATQINFLRINLLFYEHCQTFDLIAILENSPELKLVEVRLNKVFSFYDFSQIYEHYGMVNPSFISLEL